MLCMCVLGLVTLTQVVSGLLDANGPAAIPPKIAIIGGGIGGTSAALFLDELFGGLALVDLYEEGQVGGRLATLDISGHGYEVGGNILHPDNQYMDQFVSDLGLHKRTSCDGRMALFNGKEMVFRDSGWSVVNLARLFWRYGLSVYKLRQLTTTMLSKFSRIYDLQSEGRAYKDVASLLAAMDPQFLDMTKVSIGEWLRRQGFGERMIDELVTAVAQCNYGQTPSIQAFVGAVSIAGADPNLWSVLGGNHRVAEELLRASRAALLIRTVTHVSPTDDGHFMVRSVEPAEEEGPRTTLYREGSPSFTRTSSQEDLEEQEEGRAQVYDIVIIATPLTSDKSDLKLVNFTHRDFTFPGQYERIVCTMIQGHLRREALSLAKDDQIDEILVTTPGLFYNSIERQLPVNTTTCPGEDVPPVWKVFSPDTLSQDQLDTFFPDRISVDDIDWLAYPHYASNQSLGDFELAPGLYHVSAIEWAGSAMEMSVIGAKNAALLAYKHWTSDPEAGGERKPKDEL